MRILKCILAVCALTLAFLKVSIRVCGVYGTYCMSLGSFYAPRERITVHLSEGKIIFCSVAVCTISGGCSEVYIICFSAAVCTISEDYGDSYGSHRISIYIAQRRSITSLILSFSSLCSIICMYRKRCESFKEPPESFLRVS